MAAYERDGTSIMYKGKGPSTNSLIKIPEEFRGKGEIEVPAVTLNTIVRRYGSNKVGWVKVDVEGGELSVLKGAESSLKVINNLIMEVWWENEKEVFSIFERRGYEITVLSKSKYFMNILAKARFKHQE
jgi:hypothetical protein